MSLIPVISRDVGLSLHDVITICRTAPYRYKVYEIKKRSGRGVRVIAQPAPEVKLVQRWVVENVLSKLPVHVSCMGYVCGVNIRDNAQKHSENDYLLKMDFRSFFPSIVPSDFEKHVKRYAPQLLNEEDLHLLKTLLFWKNLKKDKLELSIGAPSSPMLSNTILYQYDHLMYQSCSKIDVVYTRYADDLTFSTKQKFVLKNVYADAVQNACILEYPSLIINHEKTVFASKKNRRMVTGLVLSNEDEVSLGRERKRMLRAQVNRFRKGMLDELEIQQLRGNLNFAANAEPSYVKRLVNYYGNDIMRHLLSMNVIERVQKT